MHNCLFDTDLALKQKRSSGIFCECTLFSGATLSFTIRHGTPSASEIGTACTSPQKEGIPFLCSINVVGSYIR